MATYRYPKTQEAKFGAFFVMAKDFDSGEYDKYIIIEKNTKKRYSFSHERIARHLEKNPNDRDTRAGSFQGKPFIRLRLTLAEENE